MAVPVRVSVCSGRAIAGRGRFRVAEVAVVEIVVIDGDAGTTPEIVVGAAEVVAI